MGLSLSVTAPGSVTSGRERSTATTARGLGSERVVREVAIQAAGEAGRDDRAEHRDREQAGDPGHGVVYPAGEPRVAGLDRSQHGRGQRRDCGGQPQPEYHDARQDGGQIVGVRTGPDQHEQPETRDDRAAGHEQVRSHAVREDAKAAGQQEGDDRERQ